MAKIADFRLQIWCRVCEQWMTEWDPYEENEDLAKDLITFVATHKHKVAGAA